MTPDDVMARGAGYGCDASAVHRAGVRECVLPAELRRAVTNVTFARRSASDPRRSVRSLRDESDTEE